MKLPSSSAKSRGSACRPPARNSPARIISRPLVDIPKFSTVSAAERASFERLDAACRRLAAAGSLDQHDREFGRRCARALPTELSRLATVTNGTPIFDAKRSFFEELAAERHARDLPAARRDSATFVAWLLRVARDTGVSNPMVRNADIGLEVDGNGVLVTFPPVAVLPARIAALCEPPTDDTLPCFAALTAAAALLNLHPLRDGNGRVSRVLLNVMLRAGYAGLSTYFPIYELRAHAPYVFEIALRAAELHGDWTHFADLHADLAGIVLNQSP